MNAKPHPLTRYTVALILASLALLGCKKKQKPPPKPVPTVQTTMSTKTIVMPKSQMESRKRLSPTAASNIEMIVDKAHAAQGKVTIRYPADTPKAVLQSLKAYDIDLEKDELSEEYQIIVTKPDLPDTQ